MHLRLPLTLLPSCCPQKCNHQAVKISYQSWHTASPGCHRGLPTRISAATDGGERKKQPAQNSSALRTIERHPNERSRGYRSTHTSDIKLDSKKRLPTSLCIWKRRSESSKTRRNLKTKRLFSNYVTRYARIPRGANIFARKFSFNCCYVFQSCIRRTRSGQPEMQKQHPPHTLASNGSRNFKYRPILTRHASLFEVACERGLEKTIPTRIQKWLINAASVSQFRLRWKSLTTRRRKLLWPGLMLHAMGSYPSLTVLKVMMGTFTAPFVSSHMVSATVNFIIQEYLYFRKGKMASTERAEVILDWIDTMRRIGPPKHINLSQRSIYLLSRSLVSSKVYQMYLDLSASHQKFSFLTLSLCADRLAKSQNIIQALEILKDVKHQGVDLSDHKRVVELWSTILRLKHRRANDKIQDSEILDIMLAIGGVKPNIYHCNVLIHNAIQRGDYNTGWQIYELMKSDGNIGANAHTYSILLNGAKSRMDRPAIEHILSCVQENELSNSHIVTDLLHTIFLLHQQDKTLTNQSSAYSPQTAFVRMLPVFSTYYKLDSLRSLIPMFDKHYGRYLGTALISENTAQHVNSSNSITRKPELMDATPHSLGVMLAALLEGAQTVHVVRRLFAHFSQMIETNHSVVAGLVHTAHIHNYFLMAFGKFKTGLKDCISVLERMVALETYPTQSVIREPNRKYHLHSLKEQSRVPSDESGASTPADPPRSPYDSQPYLTPQRGIPSFAVIHQHGQTPQSIQGKLSQMPQRQTARTPRLRMLRLANQVLTRKIKIRPPTLRHPAPTIYTWSILLQIFMEAHQPLSAEKVICLMRSRGIEPSIVTWEHLINGYAWMQDPSMTADAIFRMQQAGFTGDETIRKALQLVKDRGAFIEAVEEQRRAETVRLERMAEGALDKAVQQDPFLGPAQRNRMH